MKTIKQFARTAAFTALCGGLMFSCLSDDELVDTDHAGSSRKVRFDINMKVPNVRGTAVLPESVETQVKDFQVWGRYTDNSTSFGAVPDGLYVGYTDTRGITVEGDGRGNWLPKDRPGGIWWPNPENHLDFKAISPVSHPTFTVKSRKIGERNCVYADVTVPVHPSDQTDILLGMADNMNYHRDNNRAMIDFSHALTRVSFYARSENPRYEGEIHSIELHNMYGTGKVGFIGNNGAIGYETTGSPDHIYTVPVKPGVIIDSPYLKPLHHADSALYLLPQRSPSWTTTEDAAVPVSYADDSLHCYFKIVASLKDTRDGSYLYDHKEIYVPQKNILLQGVNQQYFIEFAQDTVFNVAFNADGTPMMCRPAFSMLSDFIGKWTEDLYEDGIVAYYDTKSPGETVRILCDMRQAYLDLSNVYYMLTEGIRYGVDTYYKFTKAGTNKIGIFLEDQSFIPASLFKKSALYKVEIPEGVKLMKALIFSGCKNLKEIKLPKSLHTIRNQVFMDCKSLEAISLPDSLKHIEDEAFRGSGLKSVDIPEGITTLKNSAFSDCHQLTEIHLPSSLLYMEDWALSGCSALSKIVLPEKMKAMGVNIFEYSHNLKTIISLNKTAPEIKYGTFNSVASEGVLRVPQSSTGYGAWLPRLGKGWKIEYLE